MRTTTLEKITGERLQPYNPNYHGLYEPDVDIGLTFYDIERTQFRVKFNFKMTYSDAEKRPVGFVSIEGSTFIQDVPELPLDGPTLRMDEVPENIIRLVEGALAEDLLLPASVVARSMKLPSLLPIPHIFARSDKAGPKTPSAATPSSSK